VRFLRLQEDLERSKTAVAGGRGLDPRAALLLGAARAVGAASVYSGGAADLKEIHGALAAGLGPSGVSTFPWPLVPDEGELTEELTAFGERFGLRDLSAAEALHARDESLRAALRDWEREQGESALPPYPSRVYRDALAATTSGGLLERAPRLPLASGRGLAGGARLRLGFLGGVELFTDLPEHVERLGARAVVDEWTYACAFIPPSATLVQRYLRLALPYGLAARARAMRALEVPRRLDGWVLVTSPFGASNLERVGFPRWLGLPVLPLEAETRRALSGAEVLRLEAFVRARLEAR
jgi:hypothetical protein